MAHVERITVYPVKGIDGVDLDAARVLDGGTVEYDREFALFDADGDVFNGRRTDRFHDIETAFDPETAALRVRTSAAPEADGATGPDRSDDHDEHGYGHDDGNEDGDGGEDDAAVSRRRDVAFGLDSQAGRERAADWFSAFFGTALTVERDTELGFVDRREMGPSVVSTATLRAVAGWFDRLTVDGVRRRLRANVEVGGVPAFWEDRFVGADAPGFVAGGVRFDGVTPCGRCVVPERDPDTGEPTPGFRERFLERRRETIPDWADPDAFEHYYAVMIIARVAEADRGRRLQVGDPVQIADPEIDPETGAEAEAEPPG